jgi:hypothetical protein
MWNSLLGGSKPKDDETAAGLVATNKRLQERVVELERKCGRYCVCVRAAVKKLLRLHAAQRAHALTTDAAWELCGLCVCVCVCVCLFVCLCVCLCVCVCGSLAAILAQPAVDETSMQASFSVFGGEKIHMRARFKKTRTQAVHTHILSWLMSMRKCAELY